MSGDTKYPSQTAERFQIRMPDGLRDRIRAAAERNGRSMNTEIIATLELMYPDKTEIAAPAVGVIDEEDLLGILDDVDRIRQRLIARATQMATEKPQK